MKIESVRLGFASNSSSSHSIVITEQKLRDEYDGSYEFGWENFILSSKGAKQNYLAQSLFDNLKGKLGKNTAEIIVCALFKNTKKDLLKEGYVDHQSQMGFPCYYDKRDSVNLEFFKSMADHIKNKKDLLILGGNDNGEFDDGIVGECLRIPLKDEYDLIARHEGENKWTLFNRDTGAKLRMDFDDSLKTDTEIKIKSPELIDLKITGFCTQNCSFCYQNSTYVGKHGEFDKIYGLLHSMGNAEVFEVAIGGGEPTAHPRFADILEVAYQNNIIPNFTTYSTDWLKDEKILAAVKKYVGCVAVSIHDERDIWEYSKIEAILDSSRSYGTQKPRVSIQMIVGQMSYPEIEKVIALIGTRMYPKPVITLLGYKTTGRGNDVTGLGLPYDDKWIRLVHFAKEQNVNLGIDAVLVEKFKDDLIKNGIKKELMVAKEGVHSMYIDAVEEKWGISSYCTEMQPYQNSQAVLRKYWKGDV